MAILAASCSFQVELWRTIEGRLMVTIWGWCLFCLPASSRSCSSTTRPRPTAIPRRIALNEQHADATAESWCVPIPKPEKAVKGKV